MRGAIGRRTDEPGRERRAIGRRSDEPGGVRGAIGRRTDEPGRVRGAIGRRNDGSGRERGAQRCLPGARCGRGSILASGLLLAAAAVAWIGPVRAADWGRLSAVWSQLDAPAGSGAPTLAEWAAFDSARSAWSDSLAAALRLGPPPEGPSSARWGRVLLEGWLRGEPSLLRLLTGGWRPEPARWADAGQLTVPAAALCLAHGHAEAARAWLDAGPIPAEDRPYAAVLAVEARLATTDTLGAGAAARAALEGRENWPWWARVEFERAAIEAALAAGDTATARRELASFTGREEERGRWLLLRRRLAELRGDAGAAEALLWRVVSEYPGGKTAERTLRQLVPADGAPAVEDLDRQRRLLAVAERRGDLPRFRALERALRPRLGPAGRDSLSLRAGRLAFRVKEYGLLAQLDADGTWRAGGAHAIEWALLTARAYRNAGRAEEMARRYAEVARRGSREDRATACYEWAREMEALRRFAEAETLYARVVSLGGNDAAVSRLRRGICEFGAGRWSAARARLEEAAAAGSAEDRAFAWFWIYRSELARGRSEAARAALAEAARGKAGYYGRRAATALELARRAGGPSALDPDAYWRAVAELSGEPDLDRLRAAVETAPVGTGPARAAQGAPGEPAAEGAPGALAAQGAPGEQAGQGDSGSAAEALVANGAPAGAGPGADGGATAGATELSWLRDRLLFFRLAGRSAWAGMAREELARRPELAGAGAADTWRRLGVEDLAARAAVRSGGSLRHRYPRAFPAEVAGAAARFGVAPEWLWAVMRRESFFESSVVSGAGATGLLQLMEETARTTAQRHGLEAGPLAAPRINVRLGAAHLADLLAEEPGAWPVVLAAYNAGLGNARRWRRAGEDPDFYIEMIGYRETREYVRHVAEAFWIYRELARGE